MADEREPLTESGVIESTPGRYDSLKLIPWWEQEKVAQAKVMVVGAGALGNEILKNLALVGIGHILIVDFDVVEATNLTRSVLFRAEDLGKRKAEVAAKRLKELNPDVKVAYICGDITTDVGLGVFRNMDVVLVGVDNFAARIFVNRACFKTGTPWINGGILELMGEFNVYIPGAGACYECSLPEDAYREMGHRLSCILRMEEIQQGKVPTTPTVASIIGALQVQEALKLIHGRELSGGSGLVFNGVTNECLPVNFRLNERCFYHKRLEPIHSLDRGVSTITVAELLKIGQEEVGSGATIELDFDLVYRLDCACGFVGRTPRRLDRLSNNDLKCPECSKLLRLEVTSTIGDHSTSLLDRTLEDICIPPFHVVRVRNTAAEVHFELSADRDRIMNFN